MRNCLRNHLAGGIEGGRPEAGKTSRMLGFLTGLAAALTS